jgi:predicted nucleic acid-binding protein
MTAKAFVDTNIYIYALTESQDPFDKNKRIVAYTIAFPINGFTAQS